MWTKILFTFCAFLQLTSSSLLSTSFEKINIKFYNGLNSHHFHKFSMQNLTRLLSESAFDPHKQTVFYISGWMLSPEADSSVQLIDAYLKYQHCNLLLLDWSDYSVGLYTPVLFRISKISRIVGRHLTKLFQSGLNEKKFHCVGFSFGAHACGIIGREIQENSNRRIKLARITGLDPAGPQFFPALYEEPLSTRDAYFVDTIHSDVFFIGTKHPLGHVSFFPNFNKTQPGCPEFKLDTFEDFVRDMCSHKYAIRYWVRTLNPANSKLFPSSKCNDARNYEAKKCDKNYTNFMGLYVNPKIQGTFFLKTKSTQFYNESDFYNWILMRIGYRAEEVFSFDF